MVMLEPAPVTVPVAPVEAFAIMPRTNPACAGIGWTSPIWVVPPIASPFGVPVSVDPHVLGTRRHRHHVMPRRRWRANSDADGDLGEAGSSGQQQYRDPLVHGNRTSTYNAGL